MKNKCRIIFILILFFFSIPVIINSEDFKWKNVTGKWKIGKDENGGYAHELRGKKRDIGYSEIVNYNSLLTLKHLTKCTSIQFILKPQKPVKPRASIMVLFVERDFRNLYAFRFLGDDDELNKIEFISSKVIDKTKSPAVKWNFKISQISGCNYTLKYDKEYNIKIKLKGEKAVLYINDEKVLEGSADVDLSNDRFGFSGKGTKLRIANVKALSGSRVIFHDDFSKNTIKRNIVRGNLKKIRKEKK